MGREGHFQNCSRNCISERGAEFRESQVKKKEGSKKDKRLGERKRRRGTEEEIILTAREGSLGEFAKGVGRKKI